MLATYFNSDAGMAVECNFHRIRYQGLYVIHNHVGDEVY